MNHREKIITLWAVFLSGTLFHTQLGLMPLFHNLSVVTSDAQTLEDISWILWLMLGFFLIPMGLMIATLFTQSKAYRKLHFSITVLYSLLNFSHLVADLLVQPIIWYQITLMVILLLIGLLLNVVAFQWMQDHKRLRQSYDVTYELK